MKRIGTAVIAMALLCLTLVSCGESDESPKAAAESFLRGVKEQNQEVVDKYYEGNEDEFDKNYVQNIFRDKMGNNANYFNDTFDTMRNKMADFNYTVEDEKTSGDTAKVKVKIKTYEFASLADRIKEKMTVDADADTAVENGQSKAKDTPADNEAQSKSDKSTHESTTNETGQSPMVKDTNEVKNDAKGVMDDVGDGIKNLYNSIKDGLDHLTDKKYEKEITLTLAKKGNGWVVEELNDEAADALTGGLYSYSERYTRNNK